MVEFDPRKSPVRAKSIEPDYATVSYDGVELIRLPLVEESRSMIDQLGWDWNVVLRVGPGEREACFVPAGSWITLYAKDGGYLKDYVLAGPIYVGFADTLQITMQQSYRASVLHDGHE